MHVPFCLPGLGPEAIAAKLSFGRCGGGWAACHWQLAQVVQNERGEDERTLFAYRRFPRDNGALSLLSARGVGDASCLFDRNTGQSLSLLFPHDYGRARMFWAGGSKIAVRISCASASNTNLHLRHCTKTLSIACSGAAPCPRRSSLSAVLHPAPARQLVDFERGS